MGIGVLKSGGKTETTVTFLEMMSHPTTPQPATPAIKHAIMRATMPTISFYHFLYDAVGAPWQWYERNLLSDGQLSSIIHNQDVEVFVLYIEGVPAGFAELDRRISNDTELAYFGLMPEFLGRGFGPYFLRWAIDQAWSHPATRRVWVHTCTMDHPRALPLYQKAGFSVYAQEIREIDNDEILKGWHK